MHKLSKNEKGFNLLEAILIVFILLVIGFVGYMIYHNSHKNNSTNNSIKTTANSSSKQSTSINNVKWKTYSDQQGGFSYQYPSNWTNSVTQLPESSGSYSGVEGTVTAPDGNKLAWIFEYVGGKGGSCKPNTGDIAFAKGNNCASKQVISVQELPALKPATTPYAKSLFEDRLYITETKYDPGSNALPSLYPGMPTYAANSISYQICLDPSWTNSQYYTPPTIGTYMNLLFPCEFWDTGFNAIFPVKNASDFKSNDAQTAIKIMKTFNSL